MAEPTQLGRYQVKRVLGRGAMGVVYEGLDPSLNRRVAIKTILKNAAIDDETARAYSAQFAREAQAAGRLTHPNIVGVHDFAEQGDVAYLVMEYIQGRELRSFFEAKEKFTTAEAVRIMGELLDALDFAHEAGIIHRDVKPANVMLDTQRRVKLADFGVARIQDSERSAAGTMVGTPAFMSPEQIQGLKIDRRTDIFSAGVVLYQLLTGEQPFTGQGAWTVAKKIMQDDPPRPSAVVQSVPPAFDAIVHKALAKNLNERYANAREFAAVLRGAVSATPQPPATATIPPAAVAKPAAKASDAEVEFWRAIQNSTDHAELEFYLEQFPDGTYSSLARHKIVKLKEPLEAARKQAEEEARAASEAQAKAEAEAQARRQAEEQVKRAAEERAKREAEQKAKLEAEAQAKRAAEEKAKREAEAQAKRAAEEQARREAEAAAKRAMEEKARRDAVEAAKRAAEERARQAEALAKLKRQEEEQARAAVSTPDPDATVAIGRPAATAAAALPPVEKKKSFVVPAVLVALVAAVGVGAFLMLGRKAPPEPAPAAQAPAHVAAPVVDEAKIRREVEERIRREYADKSATEQAAASKAAAEKAIQERKVVVKTETDKLAADKAAADKASADRALAEKLAAAKSVGEKAALEKIAAEKAATEKAVAEKAAAERAAAEKVAAEKAAADKVAADRLAVEKAAAEKQAAASNTNALLERFIQRKGQNSVVSKEPPFVANAMRRGEVVYVNDGSCGPGMIKEVVSAGATSFPSAGERKRQCISLADERAVPDKSTIEKAAAERPAADRPAAEKPLAAASANATLDQFIQRHGRDKVVPKEPPFVFGAMQQGEVVYVNDGSCGQGMIMEVIQPMARVIGTERRKRCISLSD